ncbi:hypothetical protein TPS_01088 [Trichinella pseudospiralis]
MSLFLMPAEFTLPSFDAHSLQYMAFANIACLPLFKTTPKHTFALSGFDYPVFENEEIRIANSFDRFVSYCRNKWPMSGDLGDSIYDKCDYVALKCFVDTNLYPAYMSMTWLDECNYNVVMKPFLAQHWGLLSRWAYTRAMRRAAEIVLLERYHTSVKDAQKLATANAMHCIRYLSEKLGSQPYFRGDFPCVFDVYVFGYLAPMILMPQGNDKIKVFIKWNCPNIHAFVYRFLAEYISLPADEKEEQYKNILRVQREIECYKEMMAQRALNREKYSMKNVLAFAVTALVLTIACACYTAPRAVLQTYISLKVFVHRCFIQYTTGCVFGIF